ncbi:uncharacterized protein STEHIDRAFT_115238 [Stereum hirsutum FP-91666 SS1]|uniref:uncharacterized protein n=1 Tax=Stereum hirsutum (strain FP-91666) TaxID=721885 RepID=UPI000444A2C5|nr:uncharacterized protein STEHIDRAFT_115238 [Stereum hirsutum FP-91666 SS1]EIM81068.1 hypothetical protein STEHIDRAFT_115238 [Stereum hirsutum FP-91666 SS1]
MGTSALATRLVLVPLHRGMNSYSVQPPNSEVPVPTSVLVKGYCVSDSGLVPHMKRRAAFKCGEQNGCAKTSLLRSDREICGRWDWKVSEDYRSVVNQYTAAFQNLDLS